MVWLLVPQTGSNNKGHTQSVQGHSPSHWTSIRAHWAPQELLYVLPAVGVKLELIKSSGCNQDTLDELTVEARHVLGGIDKVDLDLDYS